MTRTFLWSGLRRVDMIACVTCLKTSLEKYIKIDQLTNRQNICWAGIFFAAIINNNFYLRFTLTKFEMQDPTLNRNDNGSLYGEPFYFDIFDLRYMLNLISTLTLTFVSEKKVLPYYLSWWVCRTAS